MSSVPGGSGDNIALALLCGGACAGALSYVSGIVCSSSSFQLQHIR